MNFIFCTFAELKNRMFVNSFFKEEITCLLIELRTAAIVYNLKIYFESKVFKSSISLFLFNLFITLIFSSINFLNLCKSHLKLLMVVTTWKMLRKRDISAIYYFEWNKMSTKLIIQEREFADVFFVNDNGLRFDTLLLFWKTNHLDTDYWSSMFCWSTRSKARQLVVGFKTLWSFPWITVSLC